MHRMRQPKLSLQSRTGRYTNSGVQRVLQLTLAHL
jgi:hypothetical protein